MAKSVQALHHGFSYQHVYSFCELLCLLDADSAYERGRVEDHEAEHADDVTLYPRAGAAAPARFVQVKWHADLGDAYSFTSLRTPARGAASSLLQKLYKSWRVLRARGHDIELWLVSPWPADKALGQHIRGACLTDALLTAGPRTDGGKALRAWAEHLSCDDATVRDFARCLRFRLGLGDDVLAMVFDALMCARGLRTGRQAMEDVETLVRRWVKDGPVDIRAETLRQAIAERGLADAHEEEPDVCLWIHGWARHTYAHAATMELDWSAHFDRDTRRVPTAEVWQTALVPQLANARALCERAHAGLVDVRGLLPLSAALAAGYALPAVAGFRLRYEQYTQGRTALWRSDATPSSLGWHTEVLRQGAAGQDSLVALAVTGDLRADIERMVAAMDARHAASASGAAAGIDGDIDGDIGAGMGRVVLATPDRGADDVALQGDADAVALANEARRLLKQERQNHGARRIHLVLYAPAGFALFLGQRLNALGTIVTYEQADDGGYQPSIVLHTA